MASSMNWTRIRARLNQLTWRRGRYLVRASLELVRARLIFERRSADAIIAHLTEARPVHPRRPTMLCLPDVAWALSAAARRMPFRSDCLIQAMAAHRWLAAEGIESRFCLGVRKDADGALAAHAWLSAQDCFVAGGDGRQFELLLSSHGPAGSEIGP